MALKEYTISVLFYCEDEQYGEETYEAIFAHNDVNARVTALEKSNESHYADDRIDFVRRTVILSKEG